ncbi:GNAT family N-acetyltransferase [Actinoplanes teichomyceticus]|uniref:Ribosomal protein S18 acetylase RimI-like enzyme n=1 Tax=Actinoplanes teichomyceticus TaxID=1867 RepID=A0A561VQ43_ACTTI|nr:GNAT family N-acetyltransferase [Actinoplanes teichomyceticus]TWG13741.1 ribosomal protein S18 acetylase RimI-like enzyme [Actinoplanes teichomyceticus]GIF12434.1 hypothetical protein Ate01nite_24660 [Actinoplanes teichomyceticus]
MPSTVRPVDPDDSRFGELADLFDAYRRHYGEPGDAPRTAAWLREQLRTQRLRAAAAIHTPADRVAAYHGSTGATVIGFVTTAVLPASLRLETFWLVRDLFVAPGHRRVGVARALLDHAVTRARSAGALRLTLQTEPQNLAALALYTSAGFRPVDGVTSLSLPLPGPHPPPSGG